MGAVDTYIVAIGVTTEEIEGQSALVKVKVGTFTTSRYDWNTHKRVFTKHEDKKRAVYFVDKVPEVGGLFQ
jgi:hypothetical protein